jgi:hypothetical protein
MYVFYPAEQISRRPPGRPDDQMMTDFPPVTSRDAQSKILTDTKVKLLTIHMYLHTNKDMHLQILAF